MSEKTVRITENERLGDFLSKELIATIAVPVSKEGDIHAASLVYWNSLEPFLFYFVTSRTSQKLSMLNTLAEIQAACVVGTYDKTPATLQMRGVLTLVDYAKVPKVVAAYHDKRGNTHDDVTNPDNVLLQFSPKWARFTEYGQHKGSSLLEL